MSTYIGALQRYVSEITAAGPWWLAQKNIGTLLESVALTLDGAVDSLAQGLRMTDPLRCDESALPVLSRDRGIRLYTTEPIASQRYRLSQWLQLQRQRGTHQGEMRNAQPYFLTETALPRIRIVHQNGSGTRATWHTLETSGEYSVYKVEPSNWDFDGQPTLWSRWWAIIYSNDSTILSDGVTEWNDGANWNDGQFWNGAAAQVFLDLAAMFLDWKAAHSQCAGVIIASDPASFDPSSTATTLPDGRTTLPSGNWGALVDPATGLPTRLQTATFIHDRYRTP